jgi:hypothetical protein
MVFEKIVRAIIQSSSKTLHEVFFILYLYAQAAVLGGGDAARSESTKGEK